MNKPDCRQYGDVFEYTWCDLGARVVFEQIHETRHELHCDIFVSTRVSGSNGTATWRHVLWSTFNLSSSQTRSRMALTCHTRANVGGAELWQSMMEYVCLITMEQFRQGEPFTDLADGEAPVRVNYLVEPLLPKGEVTTISADGGSAKSMTALGIALSLVLGGEVIPGLHATEQCSVLYLDWETSLQENMRRQRLLCNGLGLHTRPSGIHYGHMTRSLADDTRRIRAFVDKQNIGLVIVDSAGPATGAELRDAEPVIAFMAALRDLNATKLVIAHVSKATAGSGGSERGRTYGSVFFENLSRSVWEMRADGDSDPIEIGLYHRKANQGRKCQQFGLSLAFDDVNGTARFQPFDLSRSAILSEHTSIGNRMHIALRNGALSTQTLADELGTSEAVLRTVASREVARGNLVRIPTESKTDGREGGFWGLAAKTKEQGTQS